jgi:FixJ family two-component response regulator
VVGGSRRVCIVDDDDGVRNSARRLLEAYDLETTGYASGCDFLSHYRRGQFGCLILEIYLPGLSGLDILAHLRIRANDDIPVIVITGKGDPFLEERVLTAGASAYFEKPFEAETLVKIVKELLPR